jgi:hypothetical protein
MDNKITSAAFVAAAVIALGALGGCNRAKSPETVAKDTQSAEQKASERVADEQRDAQHTNAKETEDVAEAKAKGDHETALAQCESLAGNQQKACKERADADYEAAKAQAQQQRASTDPKS